MFSRRHPYLFFIILCSALLSILGIVFAIVIFNFNPRSIRVEDGNIGIVKLSGVIDKSDTIISYIKRLREAENIKGVVIRIDSPGGGVGPSQEIYREIIKTLPHKKVVASMGAVAASGGYYVASAAGHIIANPGTMTGSIGVIMEFTNFERLMDKIGLTPIIVKSAVYKDIGSNTRKINSKELEILQDLANDIHKQFVSDISIGRGLALDIVEELADGRLFSGKRAMELGLVDRLGNFNDAIEWIGKLCEVKGNVRPIYMYEEDTSFFKLITGLCMFESLKKIMYCSNTDGFFFISDLLRLAKAPVN